MANFNAEELVEQPVVRLQDFSAPECVEVKISDDGKLWVNINGICALRVCRIQKLVLLDHRMNQDDYDPRAREGE